MAQYGITVQIFTPMKDHLNTERAQQDQRVGMGNLECGSAQPRLFFTFRS